MSAQANKDLIRRLVREVWQAGEPAPLDRYFAEPLRAAVDQHRRELYAAFPDLRVVIEDEVAEADKVVARLRLSGTHDGSFAGEPPTGRRVAWSSIRIYRVADDRVVETWAMQDRLGLLQQLGVVPGVDGVNWLGGAASPASR